MRRPWSHWTQRLSAVFFAVWFGLVGLEPGGLGACPMHQTASGAMSAAVGESGQAAHAHHMAAAHGDHAPARSDQHAAHHCTCPGSCCAVAALSVPVVPAYEVFLRSVSTKRSFPALETRESWIDFVLPFATAPPSARSA